MYDTEDYGQENYYEDLNQPIEKEDIEDRYYFIDKPVKIINKMDLKKNIFINFKINILLKILIYFIYLYYSLLQNSNQKKEDKILKLRLKIMNYLIMIFISQLMSDFNRLIFQVFSIFFKNGINEP